LSPDYSRHLGVSLINNRKSNCSCGAGGVNLDAAGPARPIDDVGTLECNIDCEFVVQFLDREEGPIRLVNARDPLDHYLVESLAGDKLEGVIERFEDDVAVFSDRICGGLASKD